MSASAKTELYVDPLGQTDETKLEYNNVSKLKKAAITVDARIVDSKLANEAHLLQLSIWSITAGISIVAVLMLIREVK
jgi:hypothetical protein|tara:strand:- start:2490 stop:2723 length:234 start_codon:yes stop_codon:yes gene_type:complete